MQRGFEMRHRLHNAEIDFQRRFHHILAVTCHASAANDDAIPEQRINFADLIRNDIERLSVIRLIMGI